MGRAAGKPLSPQVAEALRKAIARGDHSTPIIMSELMYEVRLADPGLSMDDEELEKILARETMQQTKRPLFLDGRTVDPTLK